MWHLSSSIELSTSPWSCSYVINQTQKGNLREVYKGKKSKPLDLRPKKTQAKRSQLNEREDLKTKKQPREERPYPLRKCVVKAQGSRRNKTKTGLKKIKAGGGC